jgi:hypothetical protein
MTRESRRDRRLNFEGTIFIELISSGMDDDQPSEVVLCKTIDISRSGILVWVSRKLPLGAILQIGVELSKESHTLYLTGEVKRCKGGGLQNEGRWKVGFELLNATDSDIDAWQTMISNMSGQ